jgi:hypothetical protein
VLLVILHTTRFLTTAFSVNKRVPEAGSCGVERLLYPAALIIRSLKTNFPAKMERKIKNLELKKSGNFCFYLCEFLLAMS